MNDAGLGRPTSEQRGLPRILERMIDLAVLPGDRPSVVAIKRLFTATIWVSIPTSALSAAQLYALDAAWAALALCLPLLVAFVTLLAMKIRPGTYPGVMHLVAFGTLATTSAMTVILGGVFETAGNAIWGLLIVVGAAAIFGDRRAHFWLAAFVVSTLGAELLARQLEPLYVLPEQGYFAVFNLLVVGTFVYAVLFFFVRQNTRLYQQSESLLHNILPEEIADRLKRSDEKIADRYGSASILFADVVGFTPMSADLDPEAVIDLLNDIFSKFDELVADRDLEKIKTIGDAYMVAAGIPVERTDHARAMCELALDMQDQLKTHTFAGRPLQMRIGIASGPVIAGIVGRQRFSYDLWGDTVNTASRMETTSEPGRIQIPSGTHELVGQWFECCKRGTVDIKGKGTMETWYLIGRRGG